MNSYWNALNFIPSQSWRDLKKRMEHLMSNETNAKRKKTKLVEGCRRIVGDRRPEKKEARQNQHDISPSSAMKLAMGRRKKHVCAMVVANVRIDLRHEEDQQQRREKEPEEPKVKHVETRSNNARVRLLDYLFPSLGAPNPLATKVASYFVNKMNIIIEIRTLTRRKTGHPVSGRRRRRRRNGVDDETQGIKVETNLYRSSESRSNFTVFHRQKAGNGATSRRCHLILDHGRMLFRFQNHVRRSF